MSSTEIPADLLDNGLEESLREIKEDIRNVRAWKSLTHKIVDKIDGLEKENRELCAKLDGVLELLGNENAGRFSKEASTTIGGLRKKITDTIKRQVLIVDPDHKLRELVRQALFFGGYLTIEVESSEQALEVLENEIVDAMIVDINLPGLDGITFCRQIRAKLSTASIPVMICTEKRTRQDVLEARELKTTAYLAKPFKMDVLFSKLELLLARN